MPRQRLAPGEHGKITDARRGEVFYATTYLRLHSGKLREREASSRKSAEDARRELKRRIKAELEAGEPTGAVNHKTTLDELFETWILAKINDDRISERTATLYRDAWRLHGRKQIGELRIRELSTSRADAHVKTLPPSASVMLRSVLAGMFSMAVRYDVLAHNPIRETRATTIDRKPARAITPLEFEQVRLAVAARPLEAAFVELLAATGVRPAEVLAIRWEDVDLLGTPPTVTVSGTVVDAGRIAGKPTHRQDHRKGQAPPHTVSLPSFGVRVLTGLYSVTGPEGPVLGRDGRYVPLASIRGSLRALLAEHEGLDWITPHSFRRTVATVVRDGLGIEAAQRQLSHTRLSTTEGHYAQRATTGPDARSVLEQWAGGSSGNESTGKVRD